MRDDKEQPYDASYTNREACIDGYTKAEKDLALTAAEVGCIVSLDAQLREECPDRETRHQRIAEIINRDRKEER